MVNNTIDVAIWGVYAGPDGHFITESIKFMRVHDGYITDMYSVEPRGYSGQRVQPWCAWKSRPLLLRPPK